MQKNNQNVQRTCSQVRANGVLCQSVAMTGSDFCYFHSRDRQRQCVIADNLSARRSAFAHGKFKEHGLPEDFDDTSANLLKSLDLPPLEDATAINIWVASIGRAVATQQISERRAGIVAFLLQIASLNLRSSEADLRIQFKTLEQLAHADPYPLNNGFAPYPVSDGTKEPEANGKIATSGPGNLSGNPQKAQRVSEPGRDNFISR